jgi:hypothetical protein
MNSAAAQVIGRDRHTIAGLMDEDIFPPETAEELRGKAAVLNPTDTESRLCG